MRHKESPSALWATISLVCSVAILEDAIYLYRRQSRAQSNRESWLTVIETPEPRVRVFLICHLKRLFLGIKAMK
jgi:hypothetical protein